MNTFLVFWTGGRESRIVDIDAYWGMYPSVALTFYPQTCEEEQHTRVLWAGLFHPCVVIPKSSPESSSPHLVHPSASNSHRPAFCLLFSLFSCFLALKAKTSGTHARSLWCSSCYVLYEVGNVENRT